MNDTGRHPLGLEPLLEDHCGEMLPVLPPCPPASFRLLVGLCTTENTLSFVKLFGIRVGNKGWNEFLPR